MLDEVAGTKETVSDLGAGGGAKRLSPALVIQHAGRLRCEAVEVAWLDELTHEAVLGLILDAATRLATTGRPLHIASATVRQNPSARLLHHHVSAPLKRVHHRGVLIGILHRQRDQMDALADLAGERLTACDEPRKDHRVLGVIG